MSKVWQNGRDCALLLGRIAGRLAVSLLVLVLVLVACSSLYFGYTYYFGFDQARWTARAAAFPTDSEDSFDNLRQCLVADVLAHELRPGLSRTAVRALLGPADATQALEWYYETGWSGIDPTALVLEFSEQGTLVRSYTRE
jgi:hypothetical protein